MATWFGHLRVILAAENGCYLRWPSDDQESQVSTTGSAEEGAADQQPRRASIDPGRLAAATAAAATAAMGGGMGGTVSRIYGVSEPPPPTQWDLCPGPPGAFKRP